MNANNAESRLSISYYKEIATLNKDHHISIVQHIETQKIYVKKVLGIYNRSIYDLLKNHPVKGLPRIIEIYDDGSQLIVIEEYVSGNTLLELANSDHFFSEREIACITAKICDIVASLHEFNPPIIHRDIKPSNVILSTNGDVYIIDLNAAKFVDNTKTEDTALLGTHGYAAPEQYGFGSSTPKTDIYAIGALISHLLSLGGEKTSAEAKYLFQIAEKCMQIDPGKRYNTVTSLKSALIRNIGSDKTINQSNSSWMIPGFRSRNPFKIATAILGYLLIIWLSFTLKDKNQTSIAVILYERVFCFLILLSVVFFVCNYRGIHQKLPLSSSPKKHIQIVSIIIYSAIILFALLFIMILIESFIVYAGL